MEMPEEEVLLKAMKDSNLPKFSKNDIPLFEGIIKDLFPNLTVEDYKDEKLGSEIAKYLHKENL